MAGAEGAVEGDSKSSAGHLGLWAVTLGRQEHCLPGCFRLLQKSEGHCSGLLAQGREGQGEAWAVAGWMREGDGGKAWGWLAAAQEDSKDLGH